MREENQKRWRQMKSRASTVEWRALTAFHSAAQSNHKPCSSPPSIYVENMSGGGRKRERHGEVLEREREACGSLKCSSRPRRSEPSKITTQKKTTRTWKLLRILLTSWIRSSFRPDNNDPRKIGASANEWFIVSTNVSHFNVGLFCWCWLFPSDTKVIN